jgi:hypothetical protein
MVNWALLEAVKFVDVTVLGHKGDEVRVALSVDARLSLAYSLLVLIENLLAILEELGPSFGVLIECLLAELIEEGVGDQNIWVFFFGVEDDVEESDGATGIDGVLFHVENVLGNFLRFQILGFSLFEGILDWRLFVKHHDA